MKWLWAVAAAAGAYLAYEWAQTQCATPGSSLYGGTICGWLPASTTTVATPAATAPAAIPTTAPVTTAATTPAPTTEQQQWNGPWGQQPTVIVIRGGVPMYPQNANGAPAVPMMYPGGNTNGRLPTSGTVMIPATGTSGLGRMKRRIG
jgi:hypothetical protein